MIKGTIFHSIKDNDVSKGFKFKTFDSFASMLETLSTQEGYKPKKNEKTNKGSPLISPATYKKDSLRRNVNVVEWSGWCCLDVDQYNESVEDVFLRFYPYRHICYSTASCREEMIKFRVVFELTRNIEAKEIKAFWYALNKKFNELGDPQTKDLSRMYYVPALYPNAHNFFYYKKKGKRLDPSSIMEEFPFVERDSKSLISKLPSHIQKRIIDYKRNILTSNTNNFSWVSYKDCPFVNKELVSEYRNLSETGWYKKMYQIMVSIASKAIRRGYSITAEEIADLCKEIDKDTGGWYKHRPLKLEAERALTYALTNSI